MATKPGTTVPLKVLRDKQEKTLNVTVGELDLDAETQTASNDEDQQNEDASGRLRHVARQPQRRSGRAG